ncbi:Pentatricopeptide repeat-containing protein chloroplastic [Zea mays]|uniref:Pentatricopeptide repeat-containing protein chloroplastic n=1 Tax=Zea mays TaxID=4577 RepID=A0A1D6LJN6_MAIZE|nr:Pentatricopeptide repeat-containing protein chloroplastic [Zea mays]
MSSPSSAAHAAAGPVLRTFTALLKLCAARADLATGRAVHAQLEARGLASESIASTALANMYFKCRRPADARRVFDRMPSRDRVAWNAVVAGYARNGLPSSAMEAVVRMQGEEGGERPDSVTLVSVLPACADARALHACREVHAFALRAGLDELVNVSTAVLDAYCKCGAVEAARAVFDCMPAVADISDPLQARWIHGYSIRHQLDQDVYVLTALIDMYSKCGRVSIARRLFDSARDRHVITWNAMIHGYGSHGFGQAAVELFEEMKGTGSLPNETTFLSVLAACSHAGLVDEGQKYFASMKKDYGLEPGMEHYGTMVDLLGRAGKLDEAWSFIKNMPIEPGISVYGAMLGACKLHKNVELAEESAQIIFELGPEEGVYHVLLANIYANASMWKDVARVRTAMEKKGLQKTPGWSIIQLKNEVHTFYSGSTNHQHAKDIYARLAKLIEEIKDMGYVPDTDSIHDVEDDVKAQLLNTHSEKLAIAYGLIRTAPGTTIQIKKNLRVCNDCHNATKLISLLTGREIIMRDIQRFHHFKDGKCSCGDYW